MLSIDEFSEKFADYTILSFIDFFSGYNQVEFNKEYQDLTSFMTILSPMKMTTLSQKATKSFAQLFIIILKVLDDHLYDSDKAFLDSVSTKRLKTIYNNQELITEI